MQKKKSPVGLLAVVVTGFLAFIIINAVNATGGWEKLVQKPPQPTQAPVDVTDEQKQASKDQMRKSLKPEGPEGNAGPPMVNGVPKDSTILMPEYAISKPTVNDSSVSFGWYNDNSRQKARADKLAAERAAARGK